MLKQDSTAGKTLPAAGPMTAKERIDVVDVLRGFALLGILLVDVNLLLAKPQSAVDLAVWIAIEFFAKDSFYPLFSFLFGLGFAIQMERATARGDSFIPIYSRRLLILLLIGIVHNIFIVGFSWILVRYALLGFPLMLFRHRSQQTVLAWAVGSLVVAIVALPLKNHFTPTPTTAAQTAEITAAPDDEERSQRAPAKATRGHRLRSTGSYLELSAFRAKRFVQTMSRPDIYLSEFANVFTMFLLGLYAARRGIFHRPAEHGPLIRNVLWIGLAAGLAGNLAVLFALPDRSGLGFFASQLFGGAAVLIGGIGFSFVYAAALLLLMQSETCRAPLSLLVWPGRMALTNYLLQWKFCAFVFYGYGLGFYQQIGPAYGIVLTVAIFAAEVVGSRWWLERFHFGPAEWLWRSLTYGKAQRVLRRGEGVVGQ